MNKEQLTHKMLLHNLNFNPYISFDDLKVLFNNTAEIKMVELIFSGGEFTKKKIRDYTNCENTKAIKMIDNFMRMGLIKRIQKKSYAYYKINYDSNIIKSFMWMLAHTRYVS